MAVSKRVRFEVLRRDKYTCRYCRATNAELTIDHVTPVALGGSDHPDNLVAACRDCNAGKSSTNPDAPTLALVSDADVEYERARAKVIARNQTDNQRKQAAYEVIADAWETHISYPEMAKDWRVGVDTWLARGLTTRQICDAIEITSGKYLPPARVYPYMAKICWNWVTKLEEDVKAELKSSVSEQESPFDGGRIVELFIDKRAHLIPEMPRIEAV